MLPVYVWQGLRVRMRIERLLPANVPTSGTVGEEHGGEPVRLLAIGWCNLADAHYHRGAMVEAARHQLESLDLATQVGFRLPVGIALMMASRLSAHDGSWATATRLQAAADQTLDALGFTPMDFDLEESRRVLEASRSQVGSEHFEQLVAQGRDMDLATQIRSARQVLEAAARGTSDRRPMN